eukprot:1397774-Rhodomonas_salina.1
MRVQQLPRPAHHPPMTMDSRPCHADTMLPRPMTWYDWEKYVRQLPQGKAGGTDGVTYELVKDAPLALQQVIFWGVNAMLAGQPLPP